MKSGRGMKKIMVSFLFFLIFSGFMVKESSEFIVRSSERK